MTASIWQPNGFSPEIIPLSLFEGIATSGQTVISIAPLTAINDGQLEVFVNGLQLNTSAWSISGTTVVLSTGMTAGQTYRVNVYAAVPNPTDELPPQAGNAGKYLKTNGTIPSWENVPTELPSQSGNAGKSLFTDGSSPFWGTSSSTYVPYTFQVTEYGYLANNSTASATTNTAAILAAIAAAVAVGGGVIEFPSGTGYINTLTYTWTSAVTIIFRGQGSAATIVRRVAGVSTPIWNFKTSTIPRAINIGVECLTLYGDTSGTHNGLQCEGIGFLYTKDLAVRFCDVGVEYLGSLLSWHERPYWVDNTIGFRARKLSTTYCNMIKVSGGLIGSNSRYAVDIGDASHVDFYGVDFEGNGSIGGVSAGAVILRATLDDETGFSEICFHTCWFEANSGRNFVAESCGGLSLTLVNNKMSGNASDACTVGAIASFTWINNECASPSIPDVLTIAGAARSTLIGGIANTLIDTSTYKTYINFQTATKTYIHEVTSMVVNGDISIGLGLAQKILGGGASFTEGQTIIGIRDNALSGNTHTFFASAGGPGNAAGCALRVGTSTTTSRSINAGGTINANGADYAEYHTKRADCGTVEKGSIVGFDSAGLLTDKWSLAVSFAIKSTNPSMVGGDSWAPENLEFTVEGELTADSAQRLEIARQRVDRIAYAGVVPLVCSNATVGQYVVPTAGVQDTISFELVTVPTFEQYVKSIGRVHIGSIDGKCIVKVKAI